MILILYRDIIEKKWLIDCFTRMAVKRKVDRGMFSIVENFYAKTVSCEFRVRFVV